MKVTGDNGRVRGMIKRGGTIHLNIGVGEVVGNWKMGK